ncbi:MAG: amidohydrolase family protein [Clostridia bacterium]|nr:amidohydrolase family protein [Clostridia bacterium]MBR0537677.1 amidohydrolase family protein [Clostridia bacterium]
MINRESALAQAFWETGRLPCDIRDFHAHMDEHAEIYFPFSSADEMVADMDINGVKSLLFCGHFALDDPLYGEQYNVEAVRKYPDRLRAYHIIHSRCLDPEREIEEVDENPDVYVGFKLLGDYNCFPVDDPCHDPYYDYLQQTGKFLLLHTWGGSPYDGSRQVANIAKRFPKLTVFCGHSFFSRQIEGVKETKQYENIYYELTAIPIVRGYLEDIVNTAGSERVLFGTDLPWFSTMHGVGMVLSADITDEDRRNIFYRNGERLLKGIF